MGLKPSILRLVCAVGLCLLALPSNAADAGPRPVIIRVPDGGVPAGVEVDVNVDDVQSPVIIKKEGQGASPEDATEKADPPALEPEPEPAPKAVEIVPTPELVEQRPGAQLEARLDAGVAAAAGAEDDDEEAEEPRETHAATYHGQVSPLVFRVPARGRTPTERAREATAALESALDNVEGKDPEVTVRMEEDAAIVRIGDGVVTSYYPADAQAEGLPLPTFAAQIGTELSGFVPSQLTRRALQLFALHVFLSVFAIVLAFVALRELRKLFDKWDEALDEKRGHLRPISILRIPVISGEALGGALAFGLAFGRVVAYVGTVAAAIATVLSQFETTRPLLRRLGKLSSQPIVDGLEAVVSAIPGLLLAALLLLGLRAGLRVLHLLLDGVASKQIVWRFLPPQRVPVFRTLAPVIGVLVLAPLMVAAAFGQFGTPLEVLALGAAGVLLLSTLPILASFVVGTVVLWTGSLQPGEWIQVGSYSGEVTQVTLGEIRLVPEEGGTLGVPTLYLLLHPLRRLRQAPAVCFEVTIERDRPAAALVEAVYSAVRAKEAEATVECIDLGHEFLRLRVSAPALRTGVREMLLLAISDAADQGAFHLDRAGAPAEPAPPEEEAGLIEGR